MKSALVFSLFLAWNGYSQQDSTWNKRSWAVTAANSVIGGGSVVVLNSVWYADYPRTNFHVFNDSKNWLYMDKIGHAYASYQLSQSEYAAWKWARLPRKKAVWLSGGIAFSYLLSVEILDAFSAEWGFSPADLTANTIGAGLFVSQQLIWDEQRIHLKFGYKPSNYAALRPNTLGSNFQERLLKDYNAQSYWLAASPGLFFKDDLGFPKWLQLSVGYSIDQKLKGDENEFSINGFTYIAQPEFAVSLDIDWNKLPIKRKWIKKCLQPLNAIKFPFPAVYWRNGVCYVGLL